MATKIQLRRDTATNWQQANPILMEGELGIVLDDPNQYKIGDGVHAWNDLPLRGFNGNIVQETGTDENAVMSQKAVTESLAVLQNRTSGVGYAVCDTAANAAAKTVAITGLTSLTTGIRLLVKMTNANTASNVTMNISSLGAKPLFYNGKRVSGDNSWKAGEVLDVYYDGTNLQSCNVMGSTSSGGNMILEWNTDTATTRKQVGESDRKAGMQISYLHPVSGWINEQYIGTAVTDTEWVKDTNWNRMTAQSELDKLYSLLDINGILNEINILAEDELKEKTYLDKSGTEKDSSSTFTKVYNNIDHTKIYLMEAWSLSGSSSIAFYDSEGGFIGNFGYSGKVGLSLVYETQISNVHTIKITGNPSNPANVYIANKVPLTNTISAEIDSALQPINDSMGNEAGDFILVNEFVKGYYSSSNGEDFHEQNGWHSSRMYRIISNFVTVTNSDGGYIPVRVLLYDKGRKFVRATVLSSYRKEENCEYIRFAAYDENGSPKTEGITEMTEEQFKNLRLSGVMFVNDINSRILKLEALTGSEIPNHGILVNENATLMLIGASFATSNNGWFELSCDKLGLTAVNKAVGGSSICSQAKLYYSNELWTDEEFEESEALVIMHVHNRDVYEGSMIKENYTDYTDTDLSNYAAAYDYIIKRYISECYALRLKSTSEYYNTKHGKPCQILLLTHWHDSRTIFNATVRSLSKKWSIPLVELDTNIGFTKEKPLPDGTQVSRIYAGDLDRIDGVDYGFHPLSGQTQYIQKKIADIFMGYVHVL